MHLVRIKHGNYRCTSCIVLLRRLSPTIPRLRSRRGVCIVNWCVRYVWTCWRILWLLRNAFIGFVLIVSSRHSGRGIKSARRAGRNLFQKDHSGRIPTLTCSSPRFIRAGMSMKRIRRGCWPSWARAIRSQLCLIPLRRVWRYSHKTDLRECAKTCRSSRQTIPSAPRRMSVLRLHRPQESRILLRGRSRNSPTCQKTSLVLVSKVAQQVSLPVVTKLRIWVDPLAVNLPWTKLS